MYSHKLPSLPPHRLSGLIPPSPLLSKVSDFGQPGIFCAKCVPRVAPSQSDRTVELDRTKRANNLTADVSANLQYMFSEVYAHICYG